MLQEAASGHLGQYSRRTVGDLALFAESDPAFVDQLCEGLEEISCSPGHVVVSGDRPSWHQVILVVSGRLAVYIGGMLAGDMKAGELSMFGEIDIPGISNSRSATVRCVG